MGFGMGASIGAQVQIQAVVFNIAGDGSLAWIVMNLHSS
ncbi:MAG: thiamine pyrophosphate-dependent enzyme [Clostridia bacterium]